MLYENETTKQFNSNQLPGIITKMIEMTYSMDDAKLLLIPFTKDELLSFLLSDQLSAPQLFEISKVILNFDKKRALTGMLELHYSYYILKK